ncbi:MAG: hypothetical protein LBF66_03215, partial [Holosporales bacterium]|nr:hypothetical protein [Holosporales bacterium]
DCVGNEDQERPRKKRRGVFAYKKQNTVLNFVINQKRFGLNLFVRRPWYIPYIRLPTDSPGGFLWFYNALNFNKTEASGGMCINPEVGYVATADLHKASFCLAI